MSGIEGIMPLARKLGEIVGKGPNHPREGTLELAPIQAGIVSLNPTVWGFKTRADMDAAFSQEIE